MATRLQVVFAARDPERLAAFWRTALDYSEEPPPSGYATWEEFAAAHDISLEAGTDIDSAVDPDGIGPRLLFERDEPHPRGAVHLDVNAGQGAANREEKKRRVDETVERLAAAGATQTRVVDTDEQYWIEMTDPEGNWFCVQ